MRPVGDVRRAGATGRLNMRRSARSSGASRMRDSDVMDRVRAATALVVLTGALLAGGGAGPVVDALIELAGVALIAITLAAPARPFPPGARPAFLLIGFIVALVAVQLLPLPAGLEQHLPGREAARAVRDAAGLADAPARLSLDPFRTRRSALSLLPGMAMFLSTLRAGPQERRLLAVVAVAVALLSALLGMFQLSAGGPYLYQTAHEGSAVGLFTNRNHNADLLICGILLLAALGRGWARGTGQRLFAAAVMVFLAISVVATVSRGGALLIVPALGLGLLYLFGVRGRSAATLLGGGLLLAAGGLLVMVNPMVHATFARFARAGSDARIDFWRDTIVAIRAYWPVGSGLGTFVPVYATFEDLNAVGPQYANHAHNDYLEIVLECGAAGVAAMLAYLALLGRAAVGVARRGDPIAIGAIGSILVLLLHSIIDYPLRMLSLMTLFGLLNALVLNRSRRVAIRDNAPDAVPSTGDRGLPPAYKLG